MLTPWCGTSKQETSYTAGIARQATGAESSRLSRTTTRVTRSAMTKNWYRIKSQLTPADKARIGRLERITKVRAKILEGLKWGRLYGGAAAVIVIDGQDDMLDQPLDLELVMPGSFKGLIVLDRWSGISPDSGLVMDVSDPDFGLPEYYSISSDDFGYGCKVHHSRVLRFTGRTLPHIEAVAESYWGTSEIEHIMSELRKYDNTSYNIASLVFSANLKVYKMEGMEQIGIMPEDAQKDLYKTLELMNWMMNNQSMQVIGQNDQFETHPYSFAGLSDIYQNFMLDISGAAEIPVTKLFGRSPAGLNATGQGDMDNYSDSIEEKQESELRPILDRLLPILLMSEFGAVPDDFDYEFEPYRRPSEEERKNISINVANSVATAFNAGIINQQIALKELKESSRTTGMWSNISDEDISAADTSFAGGEDLPQPYFEGSTEQPETV